MRDIFCLLATGRDDPFGALALHRVSNFGDELMPGVWFERDNSIVSEPLREEDGDSSFSRERFRGARVLQQGHAALWPLIPGQFRSALVIVQGDLRAEGVLGGVE